MPGLVAFNRRWHVGSDDLAFPATVEIFIRAAWLVAACIIFCLFPVDILPLGCSQSSMLLVFYASILALLVLNIFLNAAIAAISSHGPIMDETQRARIPLGVYLKMALWCGELAVVGFGTYLSFGDATVAERCDRSVYWMVRVTAMAEWLMYAILVVGFVITFDPLGRLEDGEPGHGERKQMWEGRCRLMCVGACNNKKENVFQSISVIFTRFFGGVDLVLTDLAAGLLLLYNNSPPGPDTHADPLLSGPPPPPRPGPAGKEGRPTWMTVTAAAHYMKYALGSYGWLLYTYIHPCTGLCRLMPKCLCCGCVRGSAQSGDFCCQCEHAAILKQTGIERKDIIFASFFNWVEEIPFFVCYDHEKRAVVIAIRGTLSLQDTLTDANAQREDVSVEGAGAGAGAGVEQVHQGIQAAAQYIHDTLRKHHVLYNAFRNTSNCVDYQLVVCGHSLGAGAAALLAVMIRPEFPNLQCFAFSPPGWLVSAGLQEQTQQYVMAVVVGDDLVPRMGLITLEKLKVDILQALKYCHSPKHEVLLGGCHMLCGSSGGQGGLAPPNTCAATGRHLAMIEAVVRDSEEFQASETPLYMPGRVFYIEAIEENCQRSYRCRWTHATEFDRIVISAQMVSDHMPDKVMETLEYCSRHASTQGTVPGEE